MKISDIRNLPDEELVKEMSKLRQSVFKDRFQAKGDAMENPGSVRARKKVVARMLTVLNERRAARESS